VNQKGEPCGRAPLAGEEWCQYHHPSEDVQRQVRAQRRAGGRSGGRAAKLQAQGLPLPEIERPEDVRALLVDSISWLLGGKIDTKTINAIAQTSRVILEAWRINLEQRVDDREERQQREAAADALAALPEGERSRVVNETLRREALAKLTPAEQLTIRQHLEVETTPPQPLEGEPPRTCAGCGAEFLPVTTIQAYCNSNCADRHRRGEKPAPHHDPSPKPPRPAQVRQALQICPNCGIGRYGKERTCDGCRREAGAA